MTDLYKGPDGRLYTVLADDAHFNVVRIAPQGGGFITNVTRAQCREHFEPANFGLWVKSVVRIASQGPDFEGYIRGENWNGWAGPVFTFEQAKRVQEVHSNLEFWPERDAFVTPRHDEDEEEEVFRGRNELIDGVIVKVYPIGTRNWIWDEVQPEEFTS